MQKRDLLLCRAFAWCALACCALLWTGPVRADDHADEADLRFQLGAERYQKGEYELALQHFLASNRLVPNRNVIFNVARTYHQLGRFPQAFRYFSEALEGESEPGARERIEQSLAEIRPNVVVVEVTTEPPGATVYVNRKDLGARGETPRVLGLSAGEYRVMVELAGYEPAEASVVATKLGERFPVHLDLRRILGTVRVAESAAGASVRVDAPDAPVRCQAPCDIELPPGPHLIFLDRPGYRPARARVTVEARAVVAVRRELAPFSGAVVVRTDEPGALVEVDGRPRGFTPTIVRLPVGQHQVTLSLRGYRPVERAVLVKRDQQTRLDVELLESQEVVAASRVAESVDDAPSSVTIIPREELVAFAYPTIAQATRGVRGLFQLDDRSYVTLGVRGIGTLGNYGNRQVVLFDGHPTNDDWIGSSYVGYDARTDLADVERIEIVRGPGSVLYGTNAFSGVVNVVTRYENEEPGVEAGLSAVETSVGRGRVRAQARLGQDAGIWTSVSGAHGGGRDFRFSSFEVDAPPVGESRGADGFETGTLQGRAWWRYVTAQWFLHTHEKRLPTGEYETLLADARTRQRDTRSFVEVRAEPELSKEVRLFTRLHWNMYNFDGGYARDAVDEGLEEDLYRGQWVGLEARGIIEPTTDVRVTAGGEGQLHYRVDQEARTEVAPFLEESGATGHAYRVGAAYALGDLRVGRALRLSGGARFDAYSVDVGPDTSALDRSSLNPRAALVAKPYEAGNSKLMLGKAFRMPSIYELFYNDGGFTQRASPDLEPESIYSAEIEHSHRLSATVAVLAAVYANYVTDIVVSRGNGDESDPLFYANSGAPLLSVGGELGVRRDFRQGWMLEGTYSLAHARFLASNALSDLLSAERAAGTREVANYPSHMASVKGVVPILDRRLSAASRVTVEVGRYDRHETDLDPPQQVTEPFVIWDLVLTGREPAWGVGYALGVYNAMDWRYRLPVSVEFRQRVISQNGRTFLASADVKF